MIRYICFLLMMMVSLAGQAKKHKQLVILHTNDTHSAILPINEQLPDTMKAGRGGFLRRIAMLKEERAKHPDLLYFDSGDFFQGSAYFTMFKGDVEVGLMNQMGLDATTIDYLLGGTDKLEAFKNGHDVNAPKDASNNTRFIIMNYFREMAKQGREVDSEIEGRVTVK